MTGGDGGFVAPGGTPGWTAPDPARSDGVAGAPVPTGPWPSGPASPAGFAGRPGPPPGAWPGARPHPGAWPGSPPGAWPGGSPGSPGAGRSPVMTSPSGLFPSGPPRPVYREPAPVRMGATTLGVAAGSLWMLLFGLVSTSTTGYAWSTIIAGVLGAGAAVLLARYGDRGVAVGAALSVGFGLAIAAVVVIANWAGGHWLLW
jgi:hypothetical protein